ncbi:MAG: YdhR family protein [Pseudomonadales bacterium]|nr:YdhR family protein [Pseudomonadales bacterium]
MYTVITRLQLPPHITPEMAKKHMEDSIPAYKGCPGLVRKYIGCDLEARQAIGVYLWESREQFETYFARVSAMIQAQTGTVPQYEIFETPVIVDNKSDEVIIEPFPRG